MRVDNFDLIRKKDFLTENEGMLYTGLSRKTFRKWAEEIGAKRKLQDGPHGRVLYVREVIVNAILEGKR